MLKGRGESKGSVEKGKRAPASGRQHSQGPKTQLKAFIGKRNLTEKKSSPLMSSLPEAARASSTESRKKKTNKKNRAPNWVLGRLRCRGQSQSVWSCRTVRRGGRASGNKHHLGSSLRSPRSASGCC